MHRSLTALTIAASTVAVAVSGSVAGATPPRIDIDELRVGNFDASVSTTLVWTRTVQDGVTLDSGEHTVKLVTMNGNTCATLKVEWFEGPNSKGPAAESHAWLGCGSHADPVTLSQFTDSRRDVPLARLARVCLTTRSFWEAPPLTSCVTALAFSDSVRGDDAGTKASPRPRR